MISRKLVAALVGLSLAAGSVGAASAQTAGTPTTRQSAPVTAGEPAATATASSAKAKVHHTRMHKATHRKHLAHGVKGTKVAKRASKHVRVAKSVGKRLHLARTIKHNTTKHV